ncbi:type I restriction endonuclease subunit R [Aquipseudomonas alcaligenes]|uniref:Type I restriction enzyme endonuclease subunit n=1 Tax=Aquipseudomonas alcaligenes TaxID=43263 RepID=A0AA37CHW1_AQUAC|nr:type I restriction endonuclease subunit R [Pseudomonas alcaligenes]BCR26446.1 DEAD/DEAH box helicase [Pseudomonas alcaligenes]GIZ67830.1 DEAD/DEAH box helicase [Pseudomonas alcaligenes]GIZ72253.1 DEAD/DEAH box helicase [Pseudomonas alcaligenes]GIZ76604.1 DEAD/DEAH box helicase [Pseudomonas alcaligenes]GIZ80828.1 DEAD/DEAH box helicase [Pseudomonas alcaligenes]
MSIETQPYRYEAIALSNESTVVAEFLPDALGVRETGYQSEAALESAFIEQLQRQAYEYLSISSEAELVANLRARLEQLNKIEFSDTEWQGFFATCIAGTNDGILEKTARLQEDHVQVLKRDDGSSKNIYLIDKANIHNNVLQVINQYETPSGEQGGKHATRFDVTVLVNGLPMVHIELKRRGVDIREAFNQINRYQRDSFWAGCGLFEYVQLFVISNGTLTKYYSNTVRDGHLKEQSGKRSKSKASNSFSFTSWWADARNQPITELVGFTKTFFAKHSLLNVLTKYCVFDVDRKLLVMRPYQIVAAERILQRIATSTNHRQLGTLAAGGYIWHTTGSGKTLTSFKAAQLARGLPDIDKVLFVVDRKDLDYQTMREYERFEKGAANSNTSTSVLQKQLEDPNARIIITTIQKLSRFVAKNKKHPVYDAHVVVIFDECHRSQFGDMHSEITRVFKRYHLFGFTGTPIFAKNSGTGGNPLRRTTEQAFGDKLHTYTIVDAINDKNVLPFRIDYINTLKMQARIKDKQVSAIDTERALLAPERISQIVGYIREHFDQKTKRASTYRHDGKRVAGFNSLFACASIDAAKRYYAEFSAQQQALPEAQQLKVGLIYSFAANEDDEDGLLGEEEFEAEGLDQSSRDFLDAAIKDYNALFATSFDTSADKFQNYYKDLSQRLKKRELDLVIVVNMFLTGFDATTLNTLWVDKNLKAHGLIQAYSRTNRILNSVKTYGNIVSFRNLEQETNDALALFGNKDAKGIVLLKPYAEYYAEYQARVGELLDKFPLGQAIVGEAAQKAFIKLFGSILRLKNILTAFDDFAGNEILTERQYQDYQSVYLNLYAEFRTTSEAEKESINDDVVFEIELIKQVEINVDYILLLVEQYLKKKGSGEDKEIHATIERAINASPSLRNKKDLIVQFVESVNTRAKVDAQWQSFMAAKKTEELERIITEENLNADAAREFVEQAFRDGSIPTAGTAITKILPPVSRFSQGNGHAAKKQTVLGKLAVFFERYFGLV